MSRSALTALLLLAFAPVDLASQDTLNRSVDTAYVPVDLEDALRHLERLLPATSIAFIRDSAPEDMNVAHFGLGMWMRNQWGLWRASRLAQHFNRMGIYHPDDMSGIVLTSFWRRLHNRPIDLLAQVHMYQKYWRAHAPPDTTRFAECPAGVQLAGGVSVPADATPRFIHLGRCTDGVWWAFERPRGWYKADSATVTEFGQVWKR